ncbi:MAG: GNAT family N-acetyltransferase [Proteobacteria bacterium]|nr:GNAT family N-acetyltransferase [Pseudomonadota bacterium]
MSDDLLEEFYRGIYLGAFATQAEPLDTWRRALRHELPYELHVRIATDADGITGGITYERYPQSQCGLVTYLVVASRARGRGLGRALIDDALGALASCAIVFGEVNDPRRPHVDAPAAWSRLIRFQRWGARVADVDYVQPALGDGLARDRGLLLIAFGGDALGASLDGAVVRAFVDELYQVTEGAPREGAAIPDRVPLAALRR